MNRLPYDNIFKNNIYEKLRTRTCGQHVPSHVTFKYWTLIGLFPIILKHDWSVSTWLPIKDLISEPCQRQSFKNTKKVAERFQSKILNKKSKMSVIVCHGVKTDFVHCWLQSNSIAEQELIVKTIRNQVRNMI